jgi:hypothetical protein
MVADIHHHSQDRTQDGAKLMGIIFFIMSVFFTGLTVGLALGDGSPELTGVTAGAAMGGILGFLVELHHGGAG